MDDLSLEQILSRLSLEDQTEVKIDVLLELPELPFEQILGYLSLEDRIKSRVVSKGWRKRFGFKLKSLFCSDRPSGFMLYEEKNRWVSGAFVQNFICSTRFEWFLNAFRQSIQLEASSSLWSQLEGKEQNSVHPNAQFVWSARGTRSLPVHLSFDLFSTN